MNGQTKTNWGRAARALALGVMVMGAGLALPAQANPFAKVVTINDMVISQFELDQRILFMQILRQPGDLPALARTGLIEDRLRMFAGKDLGIKLTPDQILGGMTEFASRANLSAEEFQKIVGQAGVQPETFRDFVEAGMIWREVVRVKFASKVSITDAELDRALSNFKPTTSVKVLVSEIVLSAKGAERSSALALARRLKAQIATEADFATAARGNSAGKTAGSGGKLGWQRLSDMPEAQLSALRNLAPGQVSDPVLLDDTIVLYQMRERGEDALGAKSVTEVDYAQYLVPEGADAAAALAEVRARVDTCDDLYTIAKGQPVDRLTRTKSGIGAVPGDISAALTVLDPGEASTSLRRGGYRVFLMLCSRGAPSELLPDREQAREQLLNQRLGAVADIYMEELRSEAIIVDE